MRTVPGCVLVLGILCGLPALAQSDKAALAEYWGKLHGGAIYCRINSAHDFGLAAANYFRRVGPFEKLRDAYGIAMLNSAHQAPGKEVGGSCDGVRKRFSQVFEDLKKGTVE